MRPSQLFIAVLSSSRDSISDPRSTLSTGPRITQTQSDEVQFSLHMSRVQSYSRTYTCLTIGSLPQLGVLSRRYLKLYVRHTPAKARINFDRQTKKNPNKQTNNTHKTSARNAAEEQSVSGNDLPQKMATVPVESKNLHSSILHTHIPPLPLPSNSRDFLYPWCISTGPCGNLWMDQSSGTSWVFFFARDRRRTQATLLNCSAASEPAFW